MVLETKQNLASKYVPKYVYVGFALVAASSYFGFS